MLALPWEFWASDNPGKWNGWPKMGAGERELLTGEEGGTTVEERVIHASLKSLKPEERGGVGRGDEGRVEQYERVVVGLGEASL